MRFTRKFLSSDRAAASLEYGLICSLVVIAILVSLTTFAGKVVSMMTNVSNAVVNAG